MGKIACLHLVSGELLGTSINGNTKDGRAKSFVFFVKNCKIEKNRPMILDKRQMIWYHKKEGALAQLGAHDTGSVGVTGSNPVRSTRKKHTFVYQDNVCFFQRNKSLAGFVKCTACVKYAPRVKCAAAREGIYFISHCDLWEQYFTIHAVNYFTFGVCRIFHLKNATSFG